MGETGFAPCSIGVPRFELGTSPTRTERATRLRHTPVKPTLAKEVFDRLSAEVGAFADQQVAAVGDHSERRAEPPGELEAVGEAELIVASAPEDEGRAGQLAELLAHVVGGDGPRRADRIPRQPRPLEEAVDRSSRH